MPIIATVGRRAMRMRILLAVMYCILSVLGLTMVVPFMITVTASFSNELDYDRFRPVPKCLYSQTDRFVKGLVGFFNKYPQWSVQMSSHFPGMPEHWASWRELGRDKQGIDRFAAPYLNASPETMARWRKMAADYSEFVDRYPVDDLLVPVSNIDASTFLEDYYTAQWVKLNPSEDVRFNGSRKTEGALGLLNETWGGAQVNFFSIDFEESDDKLPYWQQSWSPPVNSRKYKDFELLKELYRHHYFTPGVPDKWTEFLKERKWTGGGPTDILSLCLGSASPELGKLWTEFKATRVPASPAVPFSMRTQWLSFLKGDDARRILKLDDRESFTVETYNRIAGDSRKSLSDIPFPLPLTASTALVGLWDEFVRSRYPIRLTTVETSPENVKLYQDFLQSRFKNIQYVNKILGTDKKAWDEFTLTSTAPVGKEQEKLKSVWFDFVKSLPVAKRTLHSSEKAFQEFLLAKYGSIGKINEAYGWNLGMMEEAFPPFSAAYAATYLDNQWPMTLKPFYSNYLFILSYLLKQGRAIFVTVMLIAIAILITLTVNPMCAYALSRFSLPGKDKVLLYLLATMAFPAMISAIPAYLLMRDLGLLNTFLALVLPGAANGMAIFILKGFFDSLPQELYEAAVIDGAKEWQIFMIITLPMMKPILAINALAAFMAAYNGWEWALIICQDQKMWTVSVWMYQANQIWSLNYPWIVTAGFVVVSIPTLLVFLFCQKIILQGIVIPQMK